MASQAEQLAANMNFAAFAKADELKKRILFTIGALLVYRFGTFIPLPGIDPDAYARAFESASSGIIGMFNVITGGAVQRVAIFLLGIMPYISASIIIQLMTAVVPSLEAMKKEGEQGRKKITQYTRYGTVILATVQAFAIAQSLAGQEGVVLDPGPFFILTTVITLVGGTMFLMWLGEQITSRGIGNGISLIIFAGIVAEFPRAIYTLLETGRSEGSLVIVPLTLIGVMLLVLIIVFFERAQRRLLIQYPKRQVGNKMMDGNSSHLPLKLNTAGVIPPIFASSLLLLPPTISGLFPSENAPEWLDTMNALMAQGQPLRLAIMGALIIFFAFFYTAIVFNPQETADNLKSHGGYIPGIRPGERTATHIDYVLTRITTIGAIYLTAVILIPEVGLSSAGLQMAFGGASLLIAVSVTLDTVSQIQGHLLAHQYDNLIKKSKLRGKKR